LMIDIDRKSYFNANNCTKTPIETKQNTIIYTYCCQNVKYTFSDKSFSLSHDIIALGSYVVNEFASSFKSCQEIIDQFLIDSSRKAFSVDNLGTAFVVFGFGYPARVKR